MLLINEPFLIYQRISNDKEKRFMHRLLPLKIYIIIQLLTAFSSLYAQLNNIKFEHVSVEQGVSHKVIRDVVRDKKGFIWIATKHAGLNNYDGSKITVFKHDSLNKNSISEDNINCIISLRNGQIAIGTKSNGLDIYNPETGKFLNIKHDAYDTTSLSNNAITALFEDQDRNIWISTPNAIDIYRPIDEVLERFSSTTKDRNKLQSAYSASCFTQDKEGYIWIGYWATGAVNRINTKTLGIELIEYGEMESVSSILVDTLNNLWLGTPLQGLYKIHPNRKDISHFENKADNTSPNQIASNFIMDLHFDKNGYLWIATSEGLSILDQSNNLFYNYYNDENDPFSLSSNGVFAIFESSDGIIWLSTSEGVDKMDPIVNLFEHFRVGKRFNYNFEGKVINAFCEDKNGRLFVGSQLNGLSIIDRKTRKIVTLRNILKDQTSIPDNTITTLYPSESGSVWLGTLKNYITKVDGKTFNCKNYVLNIPDVPDFYIHVNSICEFPIGVLWLGTTRGLIKMNTQGQILRYFTFEDLDERGASNITQIISYEKKFWMTTFRNGLILFDPITETYKSYTEANEKSEIKIHSDYIKTIYIDSRNFLWIGTLEGLERIDLKTKKNVDFKYICDNFGFSVVGITGDKEGNIWFTTRKYGLVKFNPISAMIERYGVEDGLQDNSFSDGAIFYSKNNEILVGGRYGFNVFDPIKIKQTHNDYPLVLTDIMVNNKNVKLGDNAIIDKSISYLETMVLDHKQKNLSFHFELLSYRQSKKYIIRYKLEGFDEDWTDAGSMRRITYTNLPSGKYKLKIEAYSNMGIRNKYSVDLSIRILPPFYKAWWFRLLVLIIITVSLFSFYKHRLRLLKNRQDLLEKMVRERTAQVMLQKEELETQRDEIAEQHLEIEIRNKDITDSIEYAQKIQSTILPPEDFVKHLLPDSFVIYKPKGIVSGDFYFVEQLPGSDFFEDTTDSSTIFAVVDCTGHGVPGAFMSIVGYMLLNQAIKEQKLRHPDEILNYLNLELKKILRRTEQGSRDGMDIALIILNKEKKEVEFSAAHSAITVVRKGVPELIKSDKPAIGAYLDEQSVYYENHKLTFESGDTIYIHSDGFYDQYGGPNHKRFSKKRLMELFTEIYPLSMTEQKAAIDNAFETWRGKDDQTDDVAMIGLRI